jgi:hypothetical protein
MKGYAEMCTLFLCLGGRSWVTKVKGVQLEQMGPHLSRLCMVNYFICRTYFVNECGKY